MIHSVSQGQMLLRATQSPVTVYLSFGGRSATLLPIQEKIVN